MEQNRAEKKRKEIERKNFQSSIHQFHSVDKIV